MVEVISTAPKKLNLRERAHKVLKSLVSLIIAILFLMYGLILVTNIITQLNPNNIGSIYIISGISYTAVVVIFALLWHQCSRLIIQAWSGIEN